MKYVYRLAFILVIGASFALAQSGTGQGSQSTPSTPSTQQPDNSQVGQSGASSAAASTKAQADIQSALRRQLPASADNVTVSAGDNNKIQLSGTVSSESEKQQVEQIAHSAAPNVDIDNKLTVSSSPSGPGSMPPAGSQPTSPTKPPMLRLVAYQQSGSQTSPASDSQTSPATQTPGSSSPSEPSASTGQTSQSNGSSDVQDKIQKAIQQDASLASSNISVTVADNKVELMGTVASKDQKKTAKQIAESNAGGMKVVDHLKVSGEASSPASPSTPPKN